MPFVAPGPVVKLLLISSTRSQLPIGGTISQLLIGGTSSQLPVGGTSSQLPVGGTSNHFGGTSYLLSVLNIVTCFLMSTALAVAVTHLLSLVRPMALRHG